MLTKYDIRELYDNNNLGYKNYQSFLEDALIKMLEVAEYGRAVLDKKTFMLILED